MCVSGLALGVCVYVPSMPALRARDGLACACASVSWIRMPCLFLGAWHSCHPT